MAKQANVISHWYQLIENFQTSSLGFYESLEAAIERRKVPEQHSARVEFKEGGLVSAHREYLRMHRGKYAFDICAAPFGTGFFVSWWFTEPPLKYGILYTLAFFLAVFISMDVAYFMGFALGMALSGILFGIFVGACCAVFGVPALLWVMGNWLRQGLIDGESTVLAMPLIGRIYERIFAPTTFYSTDAALMFQEAVHNAVLEVIDGMISAKGLRALSDLERKPILKAFAQSA